MPAAPRRATVEATAQGCAGEATSRKEVEAMVTMKEATSAFLANQRIAVTGVSRDPKDHGSNVVYRRLRERGYDVFPVNPNADEVEGDRCYHDLRSIPGGVGAVVIATRPEHAEQTMRECAELGISQVWMHRGPGAGSVSATATDYGRAHGITVIDGGCPCMFEPTADFGHKVMRLVFTVAGNVPKEVPTNGAVTSAPEE
jgi:predicted CoA-binding protein